MNRVQYDFSMNSKFGSKELKVWILFSMISIWIQNWLPWIFLSWYHFSTEAIINVVGWNKVLKQCVLEMFQNDSEREMRLLFQLECYDWLLKPRNELIQNKWLNFCLQMSSWNSIYVIQNFTSSKTSPVLTLERRNQKELNLYFISKNSKSVSKGTNKIDFCNYEILRGNEFWYEYIHGIHFFKFFFLQIKKFKVNLRIYWSVLHQTVHELSRLNGYQVFLYFVSFTVGFLSVSQYK